MPKISTGSLFSSSEGWFTTITTYLMSDTITNSTDWRVQAAAALALGMVSCAYIVMRSKVKVATAAPSE
jgi:hypothetical protein